jgi:adenylate cyclase
MSLFAELKRRNVIRMAGLYLVGAWLLTQVASTVLPAFGAPAWALRTIIIMLVIGFAPAMVFAWVFELTPDGLRRDNDIAREESIAPQTARKMERLILLLLAIALAFFGIDKFVLAPQREAGLVASTAESVAAATTARITADRNKVNSRSIAVLPFINMSGDADNEYFSDGISEEILNVLAGTPELQVAARTSSFAFKGKSMEVPEIARELKVRMVLEGSVRKQGDKVRVTAQLIDAQNGFHVWSQTFDRKLEDIFAIQDEIARAIGDELKVKIAATGTSGQGTAGTHNLEAYDLYLRGIAMWQLRREEPLWQAVDLFEQATKVDPEFAQGYAGQALVYVLIGDYSRRIPYQEALSRARDFAEKAIALDPSLPEPYAALGMAATMELRRDTAVMLQRRSIALRPSFATAHQWLGSLLMSNGDLAGGLASIERATALDPRSLIVAENHAQALLALGRNADARKRCMQTLEFAPTYVGCLTDASVADLLLGDFDSARSLLERLAAAQNPSAAAQGKELTDALAGRGDRKALARRYAALAYNSKLDPKSGNALDGYRIPTLLVLLGEPDLALDYLEALAAEVGGTADWAVMSPTLDPIRCEPRFLAVIRKIKTTDPYAAKVCGKAAT